MSIAETLQAQRRVLLDLTYRNRLLSLPKKPSSRSIVIHGELSAPTVRTLLDKKGLTFAALREDDEEQPPEAETVREEDPLLPQPDGEVVEPGVQGARLHLQTKLKSEHLQKRLLDIFYESRTLLEEQGVNVLYLAIGQLVYREPSAVADEFRSAPLILLDVALERKNARDRFVLKWTEEDPQENLSLREKLRVDFGITLPSLPDIEAFDLAAHFAAVRECIAAQTGWTVLENALQLGFFSFSKLLMFLDLNPEKWPQGTEIDDNRLICGLLGEGFSDSDAGFPSEGSGFLDQLIPAAELKHVMDCDSSQALAVEAVRRGRDLVIQGPPGTGKSQTIANLIATAVTDGKKVLFVSEKMAALEVVKRRLENVGLGPMCLELHSNKANKKIVLEELGRTLQVGRPMSADVAGGVRRLEEVRSQLNDHARRMHEPVGASQLSPFEILGMLVKLLPRTGRPKYRLPAASSWSKSDFDRRVSLLREVCQHIPKVGVPEANPWYGVKHQPVMRPQAEDLVAGAAPFGSAIRQVCEATAALAQRLGIPIATTLPDIEKQCKVAESLAKAPAFDRSTITSSVWAAGLAMLNKGLQRGRQLSDIRSRREGQVIDAAWMADWMPQRQIISSHGCSLFRFLNSSYRQAINQLRGVMPAPLSKKHDERLALLDDLIAAHQAQADLNAIAKIAKSAFGSVWRDADTDWSLAESILAWVQQSAPVDGMMDVRKLAADIKDTSRLAEMAAASRTAVEQVRTNFAALSETLSIDAMAVFAGRSLNEVPLDALVTKSQIWAQDVEGLMHWLAFADVARRASVQDLTEPMALAASTPHDADQAEQLFRCTFYIEMLKLASSAYPELAAFDGRRHEALVALFRELDRKRLILAQVEAAEAHHFSIPKGTIGGSVGALGILRGEIARKRNHMALRKLFRLCASPVQAIKPVFMMSPLSVARFLEPGAVEFDILVIDEASQVEPVDALGAIARCKQIVVVGDDKQLPPTPFFSRLVGGDEIDEQDEGAQAKDLESVLSLCVAKGLPQRMLQWHYRSKHESLIAVSNKEFYEGKLFIVPSPDRQRSQFGLRFHHFPDGRFDRGNSYKNHVEAVGVVQAVINHARQSPQLTLGVGTMSVRQRQAISDELELARRQHPELEHFIARHQHEPFFVKNLENIQGDERDVILISVGYGRAKSDDKMYQNFGPLNADGGHRRLNVLITRARQRCEVFSSITADDIRVDERTHLGVVALKTFLRYAEMGDLGIPTMTGRAPDSPFEEAVQDVLVQRGFQIDNQVGVAGFFIDLAVVDPELPGRYILGIECDGASYHSAPSARDRDRLRQEILEAHGWCIHRIWSTDWFQRNKGEIDRLLNAIGEARARPAAAGASPPHAPASIQTLTRVQQDESESSQSRQMYVQAHFTPTNLELAPHEVPISSMIVTVEKIIEIEGPIHQDEIVTRVRDLWGLGRAGVRIQTAVESALKFAARNGKLAVEDQCYHFKGNAILVRDRSDAASRTLRKPELLPPQEIRAALMDLIRDAHGVYQDEAVTAVSRMLGFQSTSQQIRERIDQQICKLWEDGELISHGDMLTVPESV